MASPIRPPVWPPAPTHIQPGRADQGLAARKAFFEAALAGKPKPAPAADPTPAAVASPAQALRAVTAPEARAADEQFPRPGSIIDIWV